MKKQMNVVFCLSVAVCLLLLYAVWPEPSEAAENIGKAFGVNIHLHQRYPSNDADVVMDAAQQIGVQWGREEFSWDAIEPSDDVYDWSAYDAVVAQYEARDMRVLGLLSYSAEWAAESAITPPSETAWRDYVHTVAAHYAGRVDTWEIWNEPNHPGFWNGNKQQYADLLVAASEEIRAANPDATIVLGGLSGADSDYLDALYDLLPDPHVFDVIAVHPYRLTDESFNYAPEKTVDGLNTLEADLYAIRRVPQEHGVKGVPMWLTEVGWTSADGGVSEQRQAEYLTRLYTIALSVPGVKKVFWYALADPASDESDLQNGFGLLQRSDNYSEKPAAQAFRFVRKRLYDARFRTYALDGQTLLSDFSSVGGWRVDQQECSRLGIGQPASGVMRLNYSMDAQNTCYGTVVWDSSPARTMKVLNVRVRGSSDSGFVRLRVSDATGEVFQYNVGYIPTNWLNVTVRLSPSGAGTHWGGDGDGVLDQPVRLQSFVVQQVSGEQVDGWVEFDSVHATPLKPTFIYRFTKEKHPLFAVWSTAGSGVPDVSIGVAGAHNGRIFRMDGSSKAVFAPGSVFTLTPRQAVKFLKTD